MTKQQAIAGATIVAKSYHEPVIVFWSVVFNPHDEHGDHYHYIPERELDEACSGLDDVEVVCSVEYDGSIIEN